MANHVTHSGVVFISWAKFYDGQCISCIDATSSFIDFRVNVVIYEARPSSLSERICDRGRGVRSVIIVEDVAFGL